MKILLLCVLGFMLGAGPAQALAYSTTGQTFYLNQASSIAVDCTAQLAGTGTGKVGIMEMAPDVTGVLLSCSGSITTVAAQSGITLNLRDGATGAGTVLWSETTTCPINTQCSVKSPPFFLVGSANTAMTCEWASIPAVGNFEVANLSYLSTQ